MRGRTPTTLSAQVRRYAALALVAGAAMAAYAALAAPASAAPPIGDGDGGFALTEIGGFERPIHADNAPGTGDALYVVESEGRIRVVSGGSKLPAPFLDISDIVQCCGEEGLLSVAFHPAYKRNRLFYVYFNDNAGDLVLMEFQRSKKQKFLALRSSGRQVLHIPHPVNSNHNGGGMSFGPDGLLYIAPGDGGSGGDPPNNAQNPEQLLGKLLRIDPRKSCRYFTPKAAKGKKKKKKRSKPCVGKSKNGGKFRRKIRAYSLPRSNPFAGGAGLDEVYALGLRNPFRFTFDSATGAIAIGDVGQGCREELNFRLSGGARGVNFGWSGYEGTRVHNASRVVPGTVFPIVEYDNSNAAPGCQIGSSFDGTSVIAGFVVRDERLTHQYGRLLYSDAANPQIRSVIPSQGGASDDQSTGLSSPGSLFSFAEGFGNVLYVVDGSGSVYRMDPA